jgi:hypothetical protein
MQLAVELVAGGRNSVVTRHPHDCEPSAQGDFAATLLSCGLGAAAREGSLSAVHFSVDGGLIEAGTDEEPMDRTKRRPRPRIKGPGKEAKFCFKRAAL